MLNSTLSSLRCPSHSAHRSKNRPRGRAHASRICGAELSLHMDAAQGQGEVFDVLTGTLECSRCRARYPILAGVAILVEDVEGYLANHVKGIMSLVSDREIPREYAGLIKAARAELKAQGQQHIEDDLEAERVISLYLMNHYLSSRQPGLSWWKPARAGSQGSPLIASLVREYWDHGPLSRIERMLQGQKPRRPGGAGKVIEVGCGVGGLAPRLTQAERYLGVDSSFASIALARRLAVGAPYAGKIRIPEDLLQGPVSREIELGAPARSQRGGRIDFVAGEIDSLPVARGEWDTAIALNAIDMLEDPSGLPALQSSLLKPGGVAIQSCPYIWHESVAKKLRSRLPAQVRDSASAVEWLYQQAGFKIAAREDHVPWLFFKHLRQMEIYSVHLFSASSAGTVSAPRK